MCVECCLSLHVVKDYIGNKVASARYKVYSYIIYP